MIQLSLENWQTFYAQLHLKSAFNTSFFIDLTFNGTRKQSKYWPPQVGISAVLLNVAKVSDRTTVFVGSAEQFRRMIFWPKIPQITLQKSNLTTILFKSGMHEVTWKCHQTLMHSFSSYLSKIKLTIARIVLRQCKEWIFLVSWISCQVRTSCCELQWGFSCRWLIFLCFPLHLY